MKSIVQIPNTVLKTPALVVKAFDKKLGKHLSDMKAALVATKNPKGVGLAAPQIGLSLRIFITRPTEKAPIRVFINPTIIKQKEIQTAKDAEEDSKMEGCLSVPKLWGKVRRAQSVTLSFQDETGAAHTESFTGFMAVIIQHETDHINGILFVERVLEQKGRLYEVVTDEKGKEVLEE